MKDELGPWIALAVFILLTIVFGVVSYNSYMKLQGADPSSSMDGQIATLKADIDRLQGDIDQYNDKAAKLHQEIDSQHVLYDYYSHLETTYDQAYNERLKFAQAADDSGTAANDLLGTISELKKKNLGVIQTQTRETRDTMENDVAEKAKAKQASIDRLRELKESFDTDAKKFRQQKSYEQSMLDDAKNVLTDLTQRELEHSNALSKSCGKVILSDPVHNLVIIDIGTADGVKNGYRFECYALRPGTGKASKGYLEVRRADPSKSECILVQRPVLLPKDALSEYVAQEPEELYSPYQAGKAGVVQPLAGAPKAAQIGMNAADPIVEGDLLQNPFFAPHKSYTFYIAGSKELVNERQKSAIRYRAPEIEAVVNFYGGKVAKTPDINVDCVIAQKNPKEDPQYQKCLDLGLPVLYEWELFRFLDQR